VVVVLLIHRHWLLPGGTGSGRKSRPAADGTMEIDDERA